MSQIGYLIKLLIAFPFLKIGEITGFCIQSFKYGIENGKIILEELFTEIQNSYTEKNKHD
jgi:hypothetical protein